MPHYAFVVRGLTYLNEIVDVIVLSVYLTLGNKTKQNLRPKGHTNQHSRKPILNTTIHWAQRSINNIKQQRTSTQKKKKKRHVLETQISY